MIKVLTKALGIVELLAKAPERERTVAAIAAATGINRATATRILKDLLASGYASQAHNRGGYTLGPMAYYLASRGVYRRDLISAATGILEDCADEICGATLLAVLRGGRRFVLRHANGNPEFSITIDDTFYDDLYITATGKMLLAYAPEDDIRRYIDRKGLPNEIWDDIDTKTKLLAKLASIRDDGLLSYSLTKLGLRLYSFPILFRGQFEAVFGLCLPLSLAKDESHERYLSIGRNAAQRVELRLAAEPGETRMKAEG